MADRSMRGHPWLLALAVLAGVGAHIVVLRGVTSRVALPVAVLLVAGVVAKHLGAAAAIRAWWRRGARR